MKTFHRPGLGDNQYEFQEWSLARNGPDQWDEVQAVVEGFWTNPMTAVNELKTKKLTLPGMASDYAFYIDGNELKADWASGGKVRASFTARGLFERKFKRVNGSAVQQYSLNNIAVGTIGTALTNLPNATYAKLDFRLVVPQIDVTVAHAIAGAEFIDYTNQGKPVTSHWAILLCGGFPTVPANPFSHTDPDELTWHYPSGWFYEIIPGPVMGHPSGLLSGKLAISTYRYTHQYQKTL